MEKKAQKFIEACEAILNNQPIMATTINQSLCQATKNDAWQYALNHKCTPEEIDIISAIMAGGDRIQKVMVEKENGKGNQLSHYIVNGQRIEKDAFTYTENVNVAICDGKKAEDFQKFILDFATLALEVFAEITK